MRRPSSMLAALASLALTVACDDQGPEESLGAFTLTGVNGMAPPALGILWEDGDSTIFESARFELLSDVTFRYHEVRTEVRDGERNVVDRLREGTYLHDGSVLWFHMPEGSGDRAYINVDSMDYNGTTIEDWYGSAYLVYTREEQE